MVHFAKKKNATYSITQTVLHCIDANLWWKLKLAKSYVKSTLFQAILKKKIVAANRSLGRASPVFTFTSGIYSCNVVVVVMLACHHQDMNYGNCFDIKF